MSRLWQTIFRWFQDYSRTNLDRISGRKTDLFSANKNYNCSKRTIQRKIDSHKKSIPNKNAREIIVLMDTTYWGRNFGVMLFKDEITKDNLQKTIWFEIRQKADYKKQSFNRRKT